MSPRPPGRVSPASTPPLVTSGAGPGAGSVTEVEVRRSARRVRTVSAYRDGGRIVVLVPARLTRAQEAEWVDTMVARLTAREARRRPGDADLETRATALSTRYLGGRAVPTSVRWSTSQGQRWGSCTTGTGAIRLSHRLKGMPSWVVDYVLVHELAHLLVSDHSAAFWALVERFPRHERARGFLLGAAHASADAESGAGHGSGTADPDGENGDSGDDGEAAQDWDSGPTRPTIVIPPPPAHLPVVLPPAGTFPLPPPPPASLPPLASHTAPAAAGVGVPRLSSRSRQQATQPPR